MDASNPNSSLFLELYTSFKSPIAALDCGKKCSPYNEQGVPFCCDTRHAVPTAYNEEWEYLEQNTDLWHPWQVDNPAESRRLHAQTPSNQVLIECKGHTLCQRDFRALTCRAFPFFPYVDHRDHFIGITYYWEFEDRCWVISNLDSVTPQYLAEFMITYDKVFASRPAELDAFRYHSQVMRRTFSRRHRTIPLLHRNGHVYKVSPGSGRLRRYGPGQLPAFGPYAIAARLPFPDEINER